ncbi:hypothetical protein PtA15_4A623 [Puccinia triticina]|uniref:UGGT thioredoxin-like domain-containing protein n=1 Tax=Puccinia triticina TaxID=208348 RepID=A0ABY7CG17_9BASI|nr:uncharacterized protein PtA15_4A623 [Puccinia triticina]WAQ84171.1 hypothetical protein PtA15_4A623 [Puccinia triticina]
MPTASSSKSPLATLVSGCGASVDIKKSEYLTLDDRLMDSASSDDPSLKIILNGQKQQETQLYFSEQGKLKLLKTAEIFDIGAKATQQVLSSPSPLSALRCFTNDFPLRLSAHTFVNEWVPGRSSWELRHKLKENAADGTPRYLVHASVLP